MSTSPSSFNDDIGPKGADDIGPKGADDTFWDNPTLDACPFRFRQSILKIATNNPAETNISEQTFIRANALCQEIAHGTRQSVIEMIDEYLAHAKPVGSHQEALAGPASWRHLVVMLAAFNSGHLAAAVRDHLEALPNTETQVDFTNAQIISSALFSDFNPDSLREILPPPDQQLIVFGKLLSAWLFEDEIFQYLDLCQNPQMEQKAFDLLLACHDQGELTPEAKEFLLPDGNKNSLVNKSLPSFLQRLKTRIDHHVLQDNLAQSTPSAHKSAKKM